MKSKDFSGYIVVALFIVAASAGAAPIIVYPLALGSLVYLTLFAPVWCGALTRGQQPCRHNAYGVFGCHLRQHRMQKIRFMLTPRTWHYVNRGLWTSPSAILATVSALTTLIMFGAWMVGTAQV